MRVIAIHQPNFFPWLGYFDKIRRSDVFVFLDDAQYQKTGGTWTNRVQIMMQGQAQWLTAPIDRAFHGTRRVDEIRFPANSHWRGKLQKTLQSAYGRAAFFRETMELIEPLIGFADNGVAQYNMHAIRHLLPALGLDAAHCLRSSSIPTTSVATERLVEITSHLRGTHYLCGGGAAGYQRDERYALAGIDLLYQDFVHPAYWQPTSSAFVPGLSIIDALMHCGREATAAWFKRDEPYAYTLPVNRDSTP